MTNRIFGAPASITPPASSAQDAGNRRIARGAWLIARLVRHEPVRYKEFQERFGRPGRTFCCEVAALRAAGKAFLTHETSCGMSGLVSVLLLAVVSRRQGAVAEDLHGAADFAEIILAMELRKHQDDTLTAAQSYVETQGPVW
jgi:hypothetical protein